MSKYGRSEYSAVRYLLLGANLTDVGILRYVCLLFPDGKNILAHGGGGATRPDLGRGVQFEGHWIARPNPGRQRAGGAAGAGAE